MIRVERDGLTYLALPSEFASDNLVWATFGRLGGVSEGSFASLNVGYHVGDINSHVTANRSKIAQALSIPLNRLVAAQQVHGDRVAVVGSEHRGLGATSWEDAIPGTDAMVTAEARTYLMVVVADCAALTFFDPVKQVLGIAHCGWRGMVARVGQKTVEKMIHDFASRPEDLRLIVSPSIGPCCYEVGESVLAPLRESFPSSWRSFVSQHGEKTHLDLWEMARWQACDSGILPENVLAARACTACNTQLFYSHRAEQGNTGRFAVVAGLR